MIVPVLNVKPKVDTPEKLAAAAGQPIAHFHFAWEINGSVNLINEMWSRLHINSENIETLLADAFKVELGEIQDPFIDVLNNRPGENFNAPVCVLFTLSGVDYVYVFIGNDGNYGTAQQQFVAADFYLAYKSDVNLIPLTEYEFLGVIAQSGNNQPTLITLKNTFPGLAQIFEFETAQYMIRLDSGNFTLPANKTAWFTSPPSTNDDSNSNGRIVGYNVGSGILIGTVDSSTGLYTRGFINGVSVSIRYFL